ncbi:restriction endonuclease subunit S [Rhodococcus aetherivorans]
MALVDVVREGEISYGIVQPGAPQDGGVPIVRVKDLRDGQIDQSEPLRVSVEIDERHRRTRLKGGEVVLSLVGTVGEAAVVPSTLAGWNVARAIAVLRPTAISAQWLKYCFDAGPTRAQIDSLLNTTVQATLNLRDLKSVRIPMPPERDRRAIAEVLGALDDKIVANRKLIGVARETAVLLLHDVASASLADLVKHRRTSQNPAECGAESVAHFSLPAFDERHRPERVSPNEIKSAKFKITAPSVLISKLNPRFPRVWDVLELPDVPAFASTEFLVLEPKHSSTSVLWAALSQPAVGHQLESMVAGTSGSHQRVKPADLLKVQVADPRQLDAHVAERITNLAKVIDSAREESETLAIFRDALLPRLMSGELRVKDAEAVVADAV